MSDLYLIGIDIGTQGTKTSLFNHYGRAIAEAFEPSRLVTDINGSIKQSPDEIYSSVINTIKEVMKKSGVEASKVSAIGLDGQMAGIMGIDCDWNAVTPYDSWLDTRCEEYIVKMKLLAEEDIIRITGCPVTYAHGPKILWWKNERPEIYEKIAKFIVPTTYVVGRLVGLKADDAYIDYTHIHFSGFCDVEKQQWSDYLIKKFEINKNKFPKVVEPWAIIGSLKACEATKCLLAEGIPIVAGCGDQAATSLGAGITRKGLAFDVAGTASVFSLCVDNYNPDIKNKTLIYARSVIEGLWTPLAYVNGGGLCIKWFRDNLTGDKQKVSYAELDLEAEALSNGSDGLIFIPHFAGRVCPNNSNMRGSWIGLSFNHKRGHLFRAIMESIAYEYKIYLDILKSLTGETEFNNVFAIGGGGGSAVFNQIKADVLGIPYTTLKRRGTATLGSAVIAGYGIGLYDSIAGTIEKMIETEDEFQPNNKVTTDYVKYANTYKGILYILDNKNLI